MTTPRPEVFAEIACATEDRLMFEREAFHVLERELGFDVGWFGWPNGPSPVAPGLQASVRETCAKRWQRYGCESELLAAAACRNGGVAIDREVLGWTRLQQLSTYQDIMRPHGGACTALLFLPARGASLGRLVIGRAARSRFTGGEVAYLRSRVAILALCLQTFPVPARACAPQLPALGAREAEVLSYLPLGYSNAQIAQALGTSPRTVRNQLSRVFEKLGVATRAEAAARAVQSGAVVPG